MARVIKPYSRQSFGVSVSNPQGNAQATNEYTGNLKNLEQRIGELTNVAFKVYDQQMAEQGAIVRAILNAILLSKLKATV